MKTQMRNRCYSELISLTSYDERLEYLKIVGMHVADTTFGHDRFLNQHFYRTKEWQKVKEQVIIRDNGCDLGISDRPIFGTIYVHHMNPITKEMLIYKSDLLLNPEFLICVSYDTHNAIHYGTEPISNLEPVIRHPNDTCPWKNNL